MISTKVIALIVAACVVGGGVAVGVTVGNVDWDAWHDSDHHEDVKHSYQGDEFSVIHTDTSEVKVDELRKLCTEDPIKYWELTNALKDYQKDTIYLTVTKCELVKSTGKLALLCPINTCIESICYEGKEIGHTYTFESVDTDSEGKQQVTTYTQSFIGSHKETVEFNQILDIKEYDSEILNKWKADHGHNESDGVFGYFKYDSGEYGIGYHVGDNSTMEITDITVLDKKVTEDILVISEKNYIEIQGQAPDFETSEKVWKNTEDAFNKLGSLGLLIELAEKKYIKESKSADSSDIPYIGTYDWEGRGNSGMIYDSDNIYGHIKSTASTQLVSSMIMKNLYKMDPSVFPNITDFDKEEYLALIMEEYDADEGKIVMKYDDASIFTPIYSGSDIIGYKYTITFDYFNSKDKTTTKQNYELELRGAYLDRVSVKEAVPLTEQEKQDFKNSHGLSNNGDIIYVSTDNGVKVGYRGYNNMKVTIYDDTSVSTVDKEYDALVLSDNPVLEIQCYGDTWEKCDMMKGAFNALFSNNRVVLAVDE